MIFGYAWVSLKDQNLDRQLKELEAFGCGIICQEKQSGKDFARPVYQEMRSKMRFGDVLVVHDLSRFGRNKEEIRNEWKKLIEEKIDIVVLNMPILDTRKYKELEGMGQLVSDLVLTLLSWMVEEERTRIRTAQREGIEIAKIQGKFRGGKKRYHAGATGKDKLAYDRIVESLKAGMSVMDIHRKVEVARNTIYAIQRELPLDPEIEMGATYRAENIQSEKRVNMEYKYNGDIYISYHDKKDRFIEKKIPKEATHGYRILKKIMD